MNKRDHESRFVEQLSMLAEVMGKELSPAAIAGYWLVLRDLTIAQFESAIAQAMRKCKWFPKPAELVDFVTQSVDSRAIEAWQNVMQVVTGSNVRWASSIDLGDSAANAALRVVGGVQHIGLQGTTSEHEKFTRPRFIEAFKAFADSDTGTSSQPLKCLGNQGAIVLGGGVPLIENKPQFFVTALAEQMSLNRGAE